MQISPKFEDDCFVMCCYHDQGNRQMSLICVTQRPRRTIDRLNWRNALLLWTKEANNNGSDQTVVVFDCIVEYLNLFALDIFIFAGLENFLCITLSQFEIRLLQKKNFKLITLLKEN